jgi:hypothetical protein
MVYRRCVWSRDFALSAKMDLPCYFILYVLHVVTIRETISPHHGYIRLIFTHTILNGVRILSVT